MHTTDTAIGPAKRWESGVAIVGPRRLSLLTASGSVLVGRLD